MDFACMTILVHTHQIYDIKKVRIALGIYSETRPQDGLKIRWGICNLRPLESGEFSSILVKICLPPPPVPTALHCCMQLRSIHLIYGHYKNLSHKLPLENDTALEETRCYETYDHLKRNAILISGSIGVNSIIEIQLAHQTQIYVELFHRIVNFSVFWCGENSWQPVFWVFFKVAQNQPQPNHEIQMFRDQRSG